MSIPWCTEGDCPAYDEADYCDLTDESGECDGCQFLVQFQTEEDCMFELADHAYDLKTDQEMEAKYGTY